MLQTVDRFYIKDPQVLDITGNYYKQLSRNGEGGGEGGGVLFGKKPFLDRGGVIFWNYTIAQAFWKKF